MKSDNSSGNLAFADNISIAWKPIDRELDESHLALVNESNEAFLRAVSAVGEFSQDALETETSVPKEILRLDRKVNLLIDLVSQLIYQQLDIPMVSPVSISSHEIEWRDGDVPAPGLTVFMQVYIQRGTAKPLCLYGEVISTEEEYTSGVARVAYLGLSGSAQSWLDKLIFRHHRREVAFQRSREAR
jgi:hypothetical protein